MRTPGAALVGVLLLAGCVETRVIPVTKPILAGLPGATGGGAGLVPQDAGAGADRGAPPELRSIGPDGTPRLRSVTVRDLMRHLLETIANGEEELFTQQVLSEMTRREFAERGYQPSLAFEELTRRQGDIRRLFQAMPAGEFTPGILMQPVGRNVFRLRAEGDPDMRWKFMDVVFEGGEYRLRWFGR